MLKESAIVPGNTCPELCGDKDKFGAIYAGPPCTGCAQCEGLEAIKIAIRAFPYKDCFVHPGQHQMAMCGGCGNSGFHKGSHFYCPELTYKSGDHVAPFGISAAPAEEFPDEAIEDVVSES